MNKIEIEQYQITELIIVEETSVPVELLFTPIGCHPE